MSYIQKILIDDEQIIYETKLSYWSRFWLFFFGIILIPVFGLGLFVIIWGWLVCKTTVLALTNNRVIFKSGILRLNIMEFRLNKVESIMLDQGIFARIFGYGVLTITGTGGDRTPLECIENPLEFQKQFQKIVHLR